MDFLNKKFHTSLSKKMIWKYFTEICRKTYWLKGNWIKYLQKKNQLEIHYLMTLKINSDNHLMRILILGIKNLMQETWMITKRNLLKVSWKKPDTKVNMNFVKILMLYNQFNLICITLKIRSLKNKLNQHLRRFDQIQLPN